MQKSENSNQQLLSPNLEGVQAIQQQLQQDQNSQILTQQLQISSNAIPKKAKEQSVHSSDPELGPYYKLLDQKEGKVYIRAKIREYYIKDGASAIEQFGVAIQAFNELVAQHLEDINMEVVLKKKPRKNPLFFFQLMDDTLK